MENNVNNLVGEFFNKLDVKYDSIEVKTEEENIFYIKIKTEESGIIIWPHGKNLDNIQLILKLMISKLVWKKLNFI